MEDEQAQRRVTAAAAAEARMAALKLASQSQQLWCLAPAACAQPAAQASHAAWPRLAAPAVLGPNWAPALVSWRERVKALATSIAAWCTLVLQGSLDPPASAE